MHARVVERSGQECHRDRASRAAAHGPVEIPALSGGDTADDQPYDKQHRSDVHHGLHSMSAKWNGPASREKAYPGHATPSPIPRLFQKSGSHAAKASAAGEDVPGLVDRSPAQDGGQDA